MNYNDTMSELKKMGTAQNIKIYKRHGAGDNMFGVSFGDLNKLKKKIKTDHELALQLWDSGNMDAQALATMIVNPDLLTISNANNWVKGLDYYLLTDLTAAVISKTKFATKKMEQLMKSGKEYSRQCGYSILASCLKDGIEIPDSDCEKYIKTIEKEIHSSANRARHAMNNALIAIAIYKPKLAAKAKESAKRIGKVEVDHGQTSCSTPDAIEYIDRALARKKKGGKPKAKHC